MLVAQSSGAINGEYQVPGDKSISHRAVILGSLCQGTVRVINFLPSEDCLASVEAMRKLGVAIEQQSDSLVIQGVGANGLRASNSPIDCGNSGTTMRLLTGLLASQSFQSTLVGDASLSKRPMDRVVHPLTQMGADIDAQKIGDKHCAPLVIDGKPLRSYHYKMPVASAQVKSALMLSTLAQQISVEIEELEPSRDHTERMLKLMGATVEQHEHGLQFTGQPLSVDTIDVPGDISSAAFLIVAASVIPGSHLKLKKVGLNATRLGLIDILKEMGADITLYPQPGFEPIGDIEVKAAQLKGIEVKKKHVVSAIDEFPILFIAACFADGPTVVRHAKELRVKEVDRLAVMAQNLERCGIDVDLFEDGLRINGGTWKDATVDSMGDHRVAMAFAIAGCCSNKTIRIQNPECIQTSFPTFVELAKACGLQLHWENTL